MSRCTLLGPFEIGPTILRDLYLGGIAGVLEDFAFVEAFEHRPQTGLEFLAFFQEPVSDALRGGCVGQFGQPLHGVLDDQFGFDVTERDRPERRSTRAIGSSQSIQWHRCWPPPFPYITRNGETKPEESSK